MRSHRPLRLSANDGLPPGRRALAPPLVTSAATNASPGVHNPAGSSGPSAGGITPNFLGTYAQYRTGVLDTQSGLLLQGVAASLQAQSGGFLGGNGSVSNWIGLQDNPGNNPSGSLIQVGLDSSNLQDCGQGNGPAPIYENIFFQWIASGNPQPIFCLSAYQFGNGSETLFDIVWDPSDGGFDTYVYFNNIWEFTGAVDDTQHLSANHVYAAFTPAEVTEIGNNYNGHPIIGSIADQNGQLLVNDGGATFWEWWFNDIPTVPVYDNAFGTGGPYPYCMYFPTQFTNVTVADQGAC